MELKIGDKAPDFTLEDQNGIKKKLSDYKGKEIILYFYPKDDTPGCTKEACGFRDDISRFNDIGLSVIGISLDDKETHKSFIKKFGLNFTLLSDTKAEVSKRYGVYGKKSMYGKEFYGIKRTTFIIDKNGKIKDIFDKVDCDNHSKDILSLYD